jgi:transcriptional regulator with XRE-family HTH domain
MASKTPKAICERIGDMVRDLRLGCGWSLEALAERTELSKTYLWELEKGRCEPGAGTIVRLCRVFKISADELLGIEERRIASIVCPDCGPVDVMADIFESDRLVSGICPKCKDRVFFG